MENLITQEEMEPMQLEGKAALVTGASSGIGQAAAILFAKEGAKVAVVDVKQEDAQNTVAQIVAAGGEAMALEADVSQPGQIQAAIEKAAQTWGRLDIVYANAGINGVWAPLEELEPDEWDRTLSINLKGTFLTVKYALPWLTKEGGSVIVTSSVNGNRIFSNTGATAYSCSKAGQVAFTKMTAVELGPKKVRVNAICPGAITTNISENTEQRDVEKVKIPVEYPEGEIPLTHGESGSAEQVAQAALFLASDASSHVTGTVLFVDGAQSLLQG